METRGLAKMPKCRITSMNDEDEKDVLSSVHNKNYRGENALYGNIPSTLALR